MKFNYDSAKKAIDLNKGTTEAYRKIAEMHQLYVAQFVHRSFHSQNPTFNLKNFNNFCIAVLIYE